MKNTLMLLFVVIVSIPLVADASTDLSNCVMNLNGQPAPYSLGPSGKLFRQKNDPSLSKYSNNDSTETAVQKVSGSAYPSGSGIITTVLQKRNNAPSTLTVTVEDAKDKTKMSYSNTVAYAYSGDKCYVAEASAKNSEIRDSATKKPVDMVVYNKEMCDQVLSLSNKLSDNDLQKCGSVFDSVQAVSKQFEAKLAAEGRKMSVGEMGMVATYSQKWEPSAIDVISNCKGNRFFYPVSGIPASNATYPMGGGIVGAGGIGSSSSKGSSEPAH